MILFNHAQTLAIIGGLRLDWPAEVELILKGILSFNLFRVPALSCLQLGDFSFSWRRHGVYSDGPLRVLCVSRTIGLLLVITFIKAAAECCHKVGLADRAEQTLTFVYSLILTYTWGVMGDAAIKTISTTAVLLSASEATNGVVSTYINEQTHSYFVLFMPAVGLLIGMQIYYAVRFMRKMRAHRAVVRTR